MNYPIKLTPVYKQIIWGGDYFKTKYNKDTPYDITAESWETASHKNGENIIQNGIHKNKTITQLLKDDPLFLGGLIKDKTTLPVLFKLIDACDTLSVQVHPDDGMAAAENDKGKTEMWTILAAKEGAGVYLGLKNKMTKQEFEQSINNSTLTGFLQFVPCKEGDNFFIEAGLLHAIGKGVVIAEIQQNSDTTYRVYDWGRTDKNGNQRELHVKKAIMATNLDAAAQKAQTITKQTGGASVTYLPCCNYFAAKKMDIKSSATVTPQNASFHILFCAEGSCGIEVDGNKEIIKTGQTVLVSAAAQSAVLSGMAVVYDYFITDFEKDYINELKDITDIQNIYKLKRG